MLSSAAIRAGLPPAAALEHLEQAANRAQELEAAMADDDALMEELDAQDAQATAVGLGRGEPDGGAAGDGGDGTQASSWSGSLWWLLVWKTQVTVKPDLRGEQSSADGAQPETAAQQAWSLLCMLRIIKVSSGRVRTFNRCHHAWLNPGRAAGQHP